MYGKPKTPQETVKTGEQTEQVEEDKIHTQNQLCFTMFCEFLLQSRVNQLHVYIHPFFFGFPSHLSHHRILSRVPQLYSRFPWCCAKLLLSCLTLCNPIDCSPPASSVHGILQARILEWVAMPSSRRSSQPRDRTRVSYISHTGRQVPYHQHHLGSPGYHWLSILYVVSIKYICHSQYPNFSNTPLLSGCPCIFFSTSMSVSLFCK